MGNKYLLFTQTIDFINLIRIELTREPSTLTALTFVVICCVKVEVGHSDHTKILLVGERGSHTLVQSASR